MPDVVQLPDHYEVLQLSPRADNETIQRVFRHMAKRFHPDNAESGDASRFARVMEAFRVLSDPDERARYDAGYEDAREARWRIFDQATVVNDVTQDRRIRQAVLSVLYAARRSNADRPGVGIVTMERLLGCPEDHLKFHMWYLKENGLIQRMEDGTLAITAAGVDRVIDMGGPDRVVHQLRSGDAAANSAAASHHDSNGNGVPRGNGSFSSNGVRHGV